MSFFSKHFSLLSLMILWSGQRPPKMIIKNLTGEG